MLDTRPLLFPTTFPPITRDNLLTLQVNLGYRCNLSCTHCHVNAGPKRTESMSFETINEILAFIDRSEITHLDLTGGAPEMNPYFRELVKAAKGRGVRVTDRCNLTILEEAGHEDLALFLAENGVEIVASLPCYQPQNVSEQRGKGVFEQSIKALQRLNRLGYGVEADKPLSLVYNPNGAFLPPPQQALEADYKQHLGQKFDIVFNDLLTITNMPISRFGSVLLSHNQFADYLTLLKDNYQTVNLQSVMCKTLISIDWQGFVYDCDFNQMLDLPFTPSNAKSFVATDKRQHISELNVQECVGKSIATGEHCWGCVAGQGSSCSGALV